MSARPPELVAAARAMVQANADFVLIGGFAVIANRFVRAIGIPQFCCGPAPTLRCLKLLGPQPQVSRGTYENPLELILGGSGLVVAAVVSVLRLVRDWSNTRRLGAAEVDRAEADARERHTRADEREARAELTRWLADEAKAGRAPIPIGNCLRRPRRLTT